MLRIKRPTAKVILSRYKQTGTFFDKKIPENRSRCLPNEVDTAKIEHSPEVLKEEGSELKESGLNELKI